MLFRSFVIITIIVNSFGCQRSADTSQQTAAVDTIGTDTNKKEGVNAQKNEFAEFAALKGNVILRVRDWRKDISMDVLGQPRDTSMQVLGEGADTHMGASIHTYEYDNLKLQFYGPKDGKDNWIQNIQMTGPGWTTARGIEVGDSVTDLKTLYPKASNELTGNPNLYRYEVDESTIEFTIKNDMVSNIAIMYNIP